MSKLPSTCLNQTIPRARFVYDHNIMISFSIYCNENEKLHTKCGIIKKHGEKRQRLREAEI